MSRFRKGMGWGRYLDLRLSVKTGRGQAVQKRPGATPVPLCLSLASNTTRSYPGCNTSHLPTPVVGEGLRDFFFAVYYKGALANHRFVCWQPGVLLE
jgi:hypothetical protein